MIQIDLPSPAPRNPFGGTPDSVVTAWEQAWNSHDMEAAANLVTDNIEFVTVAGLWLRGREEFLAHHRRIHQMQMRESRWRNLARAMRPITQGLVLVHLEWSIEGERDPDGSPRPSRCGLFTWLITVNGGYGWRLRAAHNTNLRSDLRHRLSGEGVEPDHTEGAS